MAYWLIKSEPSTYSFAQLQKDKKTVWDGIRNFEARNNLRAMKKGDLLLFYHSGDGKEIVGIAKVIKTAYQDPKTDEDWSAVDVSPVKAIKMPVTLQSIKAHKKLREMALVRRSRLSVAPVTEEEFELVLAEGKTSI